MGVPVLTRMRRIIKIPLLHREEIPSLLLSLAIQPMAAFSTLLLHLVRMARMVNTANMDSMGSMGCAVAVLIATRCLLHHKAK